MVAAVAAKRAEGVAGEALGVQSGDDVAGAENVAVHEGDVLFAVAVVPERDDAKAAEARREIGDGVDLDANAVRPVTLAVMAAVALDEVFEAGR